MDSKIDKLVELINVNEVLKNPSLPEEYRKAVESNKLNTKQRHDLVKVLGNTLSLIKRVEIAIDIFHLAVENLNILEDYKLLIAAILRRLQINHKFNDFLIYEISTYDPLAIDINPVLRLSLSIAECVIEAATTAFFERESPKEIYSEQASNNIISLAKDGVFDIIQPKNLPTMKKLIGHSLNSLLENDDEEEIKYSTSSHNVQIYQRPRYDSIGSENSESLVDSDDDLDNFDNRGDVDELNILHNGEVYNAMSFSKITDITDEELNLTDKVDETREDETIEDETTSGGTAEDDGINNNITYEFGSLDVIMNETMEEKLCETKSKSLEELTNDEDTLRNLKRNSLY